MAKREDESSGGGVAGDGGDGGHRKGEEFRYDGAEHGVSEDESVLLGLSLGRGPGPIEVVAVGEVFAVGGGDEGGGGGGGFLAEAAEGGVDGGEEGGVEAVLAVAGEC